MTWMPTGGLRLWLRHPMRMYTFAFGCCPVCKSSPPKPDCPVCHGTHKYGPKLTPDLQAEWLVQFRGWLGGAS